MKKIQRVSLLRSRYGLCFAFLLVASTLGASTSAMADFNVWYYDDNQNYEYGDVAAGSTVMNPPSWACGVRFYNASYYRWVGEYGNTLGSANFNKDVQVWLPIAGCPYPNSLVIEYTDGSQTFVPVQGTYRMEISTNYGRRWINEDGAWPFCNNCSASNDFQVATEDWGLVIAAFVNLEKARGPYKHKFYEQWSMADQALTALRKKVFGAITARGRVALDNRGVNVAVLLERRAQLSLGDTADLLKQCRLDQTSESRAESNSSTCDMAMDKVIKARGEWLKIGEDARVMQQTRTK